MNSILTSLLTLVIALATSTTLAAQSVTTFVSGKIYRLTNNQYPTRVLSASKSDNNLYGAVVDSTSSTFEQLWVLEGSGTQWALKNVLTGQYINPVNTTASVQYTARNTSGTFTLGVTNGKLTFDGKKANGTASGFGLHCDAQNKIVAWTSASDASKWTAQEVTPNAADLQAARDAWAPYNNLNTHSTAYTTILRLFFDDAACTQLKAEHRSKTDAAFRAELAANGLPVELQEMAIRVKNNTWNSANADANNYEKSFRIAAYKGYSDFSKWNATDKVGSAFLFSRLSNPTGITCTKEQMVLLFVDADAGAGTQLQAEINKGYDTGGKTYPLKKGLNVILPDRDGQLYIFYNISDTNKKLADVPAINIHVEGGRANGYFDIDRHTNADWTRLRNLGHGFFQDEVLPLKAKHTLFLFSYAGLKEQEDRGNWHYNGEYKGPIGVMKRWDDINEMEHQLIHADQFYDRFNCLLIARSFSGAQGITAYATNYGTYYGSVGSLFSYKELALGSPYDNAGNIWAIAHEIGHHYQRLFNIIGSTEASNNLFSNMAVWKRGAHVSRGVSLPAMLDDANRNVSWYQRGLGPRMRMFWQLWLYYVELGHKPTFFRELTDKLRQSPLNSSNANTDLYKFARFCSDVAQEDLTEFFEQWGFFSEVGKPENNYVVKVSQGDAFYNQYYGYMNIIARPEDAAATKAHMAQYATKRTNLFFIDDRILPVPATYEGAPAGQMRWGTSPGVTPGDPNSVGNVGMYTDFGTPSTPAAGSTPNRVQLIGHTVKVTGTGAVGYKVYDNTGRLVYVSNRNNFVLPDSLNVADLVVKVAGGDGADVPVIEHGAVKAAYDKPAPAFVNSADLALSTNYAAPEHPYYIRNNNNQRYVAASTKAAATDGSDKGGFAFFAGDADGEYYIYSIGAQKWLGYNNADAGASKVTLHSEIGNARPWRVVRETEGGSTVDIFPTINKDVANGKSSWNWFGGIGGSYSSMGFYGHNDNGSSWQLEGSTPYILLHENVTKAKTIVDKVGVGYPAAGSAGRTGLAMAITDARAKLSAGSVTAPDVALLAAAVNSFTTDADVLLPEDGKVYRISFALNGRYLSNRPGSGSKIGLTTTKDNSTLWVCQIIDGKRVFASAEGNGYLTRVTGGSGLPDFRTDYAKMDMGRAKRFGGLYLSTTDFGTTGRPRAVFVGVAGQNFLNGNSNDNYQWENGNSGSSSLLFEEVTDYAFPVRFHAGTNGQFATTMLPFAAKLPTGVTAQTITGTTATLAQLTPISGNIVPAATPVLLTADTAGEKPLTPAPYAAPLTTTGLTGTLVRIANTQLDQASKTYYALTLSEAGEFVLRRISTAAIPANRAYLVVPGAYSAGSAQEFSFSFGSITGLDALTPATDSGTAPVIYDLSGRRVQRPIKGGLYIVNGHRVVMQ